MGMTEAGVITGRARDPQGLGVILGDSDGSVLRSSPDGKEEKDEEGEAAAGHSSAVKLGGGGSAGALLLGSRGSNGAGSGRGSTGGGGSGRGSNGGSGGSGSQLNPLLQQRPRVHHRMGLPGTMLREMSTTSRPTASAPLGSRRGGGGGGTHSPNVPMIRSVLMQVASAVRALHQAGLLHGEITPENVLLVLPASFVTAGSDGFHGGVGGGGGGGMIPISRGSSMMMRGLLLPATSSNRSSAPVVPRSIMSLHRPQSGSSPSPAMGFGGFPMMPQPATTIPSGLGGGDRGSSLGGVRSQGLQKLPHGGGGGMMMGGGLSPLAAVGGVGGSLPGGPMLGPGSTSPGLAGGAAIATPSSSNAAHARSSNAANASYHNTNNNNAYGPSQVASGQARNSSRDSLSLSLLKRGSGHLDRHSMQLPANILTLNPSGSGEAPSNSALMRIGRDSNNGMRRPPADQVRSADQLGHLFHTRQGRGKRRERVTRSFSGWKVNLFLTASLGPCFLPT